MTVFDQSRAFHAADAVLARWSRDPHALVQVLRETQAVTHWLPRDLLAHIAQAMPPGWPRSKAWPRFTVSSTLARGRTRVPFSDNITDRLLQRGLLAQPGAPRCGAGRARCPVASVESSAPLCTKARRC
jgi:[NiFe] hydrogenase diaphorase moiety large subunit